MLFVLVVLEVFLCLSFFTFLYRLVKTGEAVSK